MSMDTGHVGVIVVTSHSLRPQKAGRAPQAVNENKAARRHSSVPLSF
jgi:hypothetical protein